MDELKLTELEFDQLAKLVESEKPVRMIMKNGYQAEGVIEAFDTTVIIARVKEQLWMIYRCNLSTIVLG